MIDADTAARLVALIQPSLGREYPCKPGHVLATEADLRPPRAVTPLFSGCFDWHSAVHSHWALVRLLRLHPGAPWAAALRAELSARITADAVAAELAHRRAQPGFELPYGVAWLLALGAELHAAGELAASWRAALAPLIDLAADHFAAWLERLPAPIRGGEHSQSAFAMGLALDAAGPLGRRELAALVRARARDFYESDRDAPLAYEPSAYDFLSPTLAEADLMRRVLSADAFAIWLHGFCPILDLAPVTAADRADGKLVHWDGLDLSRAWMLADLAAALPAADPRAAALAARAREHLAAGLPAAFTEHYAGSHWLGTFAVRALTGAALPP